MKNERGPSMCRRRHLLGIAQVASPRWLQRLFAQHLEPPFAPLFSVTSPPGHCVRRRLCVHHCVYSNLVLPRLQMRRHGRGTRRNSITRSVPTTKTSKRPLVQHPPLQRPSEQPVPCTLLLPRRYEHRLAAPFRTQDHRPDPELRAPPPNHDRASSSSSSNCLMRSLWS